jgi:hypothetical protein
MKNLLPVCLLALLAQQSVQPPVTFKSEVNYVEVDARVTDAQGNFVKTLTQADFKIV